MSLLDESFQCEHCDRVVTHLTTCGYTGCERYSPRFEESIQEEAWNISQLQHEQEVTERMWREYEDEHQE